MSDAQHSAGQSLGLVDPTSLLAQNQQQRQPQPTNLAMNYRLQTNPTLLSGLPIQPIQQQQQQQQSQTPHPALHHRPQPNPAAEGEIAAFWQQQVREIESGQVDFKFHQLPLARIKKVMKADEDAKVSLSCFRNKAYFERGLISFNFYFNRQWLAFL